MSLSDRDIELAKKHSEYRIGAGDYCFTEDEFKAFLAERDQLAIKEKDDAVREALEKAADLCDDMVLYTGLDCANAIRALIEDKKEDVRL